MLERLEKLGWIAWQARTTYLEPIGYTPEEYENADEFGLLGEVRDTGVVVYEARLEAEQLPFMNHPRFTRPKGKRKE